jgi:hypothetical protein
MKIQGKILNQKRSKKQNFEEMMQDLR